MSLFKVVTIITGAQGSPWMNVLHFDSAGPGTAQQAATAASNFWGAADAFMDSSSSWTQDPTVVEFESEHGHPTAFHTVTTGSGVGAVADLSLPYATQALVRLYTGEVVNGHQVRGRINVPGITRNNLAEGVANAALISGLNAAGAALIADANSALSIWSREVKPEDATPRTEARLGSQWLVTTASCSTQFAVLTSRRD